MKSRNAPTSSHFQRRQFFALDHSSYGLGGQIQQFSRLAWSQQRSRVGLLVHAQFSLEREFERLLDEGRLSCRFADCNPTAGYDRLKDATLTELSPLIPR